MHAEAWLAARRAEIDAKLWNPQADPQRDRATFTDYAQQWLAARDLRPKTRDEYRRILDHHLLPEFGGRELRAITPADVRAWHSHLLLGRPTMRAHVYALLRTIMATAVADELIGANPCRIRGAGQSKRVHKVRPASPTELVALADAMPERLKLAVPLASWCALRSGELRELRRGDVDLEQEVIRVRRAVVRVGGRDVVGLPKSAAGVRDVSVPPHLIEIVRLHLAEHVGPHSDSLLFPAASGGHLATWTLYHHWNRARRMAGRPDLRFHDLRGSGLVLAAIAGATLSELMSRAGHSSVEAAMIYQTVAKGRDREIAGLLSKLADDTP